MTTFPHVYVQADIPAGVTIDAWRGDLLRQATPSRRARMRALRRRLLRFRP